MGSREQESERLLALVRRLITRTAAGAVRWEPTDLVETYVWATPQGSVTIGKPPDPVGKEVFQVVVRDESGIETNELTTRGFALNPEAYGPLSDLWRAAHAHANTGSRVIDLLLDQLD